jgi:hypothetical protein
MGGSAMLGNLPENQGHSQATVVPAVCTVAKEGLHGFDG